MKHYSSYVIFVGNKIEFYGQYRRGCWLKSNNFIVRRTIYVNSDFLQWPTSHYSETQKQN
jgi:hypothetical protein